MENDPRAAIAKLLDVQQPNSLLLLSPDPHDEWLRWCRQHCGAAVTAVKSDALAALEPLGRFDMALVIGLLEQLDKNSGMQVLGRLRNVHTQHLYALIDAEAHWSDTDCFSLALQRADRFAIEGHQLTLYAYDLANYNRVRSWNNAKYWANPQNFGKYWW